MARTLSSPIFQKKFSNFPLTVLVPKVSSMRSMFHETCFLLLFFYNTRVYHDEDYLLREHIRTPASSRAKTRNNKLLWLTCTHGWTSARISWTQGGTLERISSIHMPFFEICVSLYEIVVRIQQSPLSIQEFRVASENWKIIISKRTRVLSNVFKLFFDNPRYQKYILQWKFLILDVLTLVFGVNMK